MKIVALADTHGKHRKVSLPDGDVLVHAGDWTNFGSGREDFLEWYEGQSFELRVLILGNHESGSLSRISQYGLEGELEQRDDIQYIGARCEQFNGIRFGSNSDPELDVLVTHQPPKGILDKDAEGNSLGSKAVRELCRETQPDLHMFGHIHDNYGRETRRDTTFVNCALAGIDYEPVHSPQVIKLDSGIDE